MQLSFILLALLSALSVSALPTSVGVDTRDVALADFSGTKLGVAESSKTDLVARVPSLPEAERLRGLQAAARIQATADHWNEVATRMREAMSHPYFPQTAVAEDLRQAYARFSTTLRQVMYRRSIPIPPPSAFETETSVWDMLNLVTSQDNLKWLWAEDRFDISKQVNEIERLLPQML
ncbi:hypothetical protein FRB99_003398 [Tulasnella sp. 403]|nr:hypothetical protein FRB99_003398 [Tulasnella sp. 403]